MELIGVRVSKEIKDKLQAIADEEQRPLSNLVRIIITDWLKGREAQETKKKPRKKP
jgi:predicted transcriptional regulator